MSAPLSKDEAYARLGSITREMHEALTVLGNNQLHSIVAEIPNARERLIYVGNMTEEAANKVLTLVETAKPACDELAAGASALVQSLEQSAAGDLGAERARTATKPWSIRCTRRCAGHSRARTYRSCRNG